MGCTSSKESIYADSDWDEHEVHLRGGAGGPSGISRNAIGKDKPLTAQQKKNKRTKASALRRMAAREEASASMLFTKFL